MLMRLVYFAMMSPARLTSGPTLNQYGNKRSIPEDKPPPNSINLTFLSLSKELSD